MDSKLRPSGYELWHAAAPANDDGRLDDRGVRALL